MSSRIHYTSCPLCGSARISQVFLVKDHTVSNHEFQVWECGDCLLRFTQDIPGQNDIGPYYRSDDYISHSNTSKGMINSMYQWVRRRTLRQKRSLVQRSTGLQKGSLLDLGSGIGSFANEMKQAGWEVTALEPDAGARAKAKELYSLDVSDTSILKDLPVAGFDAITLWHVLEHVHDLHGYLDKLGSLLKPKGTLIIAVPNYTSKDAVIYQQNWAAYDVPRHLYHFSPHSMDMLAKKHELEIKEYKAMWYDSFYISMLSSKYKNGKTNLFSAFFNGLRSNFKALSNVKLCSSVIYVIRKS
jgi:2-polyprenyl-3-methyl-5-hydroxy-6-metoxy-1,4-benzoquinol methylase